MICDALTTEQALALRAMFETANYERTDFVDTKTYSGALGEHYACAYNRSVELEKNEEFINACIPLGAHLPDGSTRIRAYKMGPGDFFRVHKDNEVSFIYYLCRRWKIDWGGLLMVKEGDGYSHIVPRFNCMAIIPKLTPHYVSVLAPYALEPRYAVTGFIE